MKKNFILLTIIVVIVSCKNSVNNRSENVLQSKKEVPLGSWEEGKTKQAIIDFVSSTTNKSSNKYIPPEDRIVVFDNDGTLWSEQPMYFQFMFALDQIRAMQKQHPEWQHQEPFSAVLAGDMKKVMESGEQGIAKLMMVSHTGMTVNEFAETVQRWIDTAKHPIKNMRYKDMTFLPMRELIDYFQQSGFKTYIVSGGGIEFMRPWTLPVYKIPKEQVIGSSVKTQFEIRNDTPVLVRLTEINFIDNGPGKPTGINQYIGKQPVAAFGNSDGDLEMLEWTASNPQGSLVMIVHHTDSVREYAYDRHSAIGTLDKALDTAIKRGWNLIDMKHDWKAIYK